MAVRFAKLEIEVQLAKRAANDEAERRARQAAMFAYRAAGFNSRQIADALAVQFGGRVSPDSVRSRLSKARRS